MALFEGYERRIDHINETLKKYGMEKVEDAKAICES
ncbi:MAG: GGGtGRT protein, partial [Schwartzia sp.]|nr:GGGtGRT protein [Schwartzia sp. (in: firmicutes)]